MLTAPGSGAVRIARGLVCALAALLLGDGAHIVAGGHPPGLLVLLLSFVVLAFVGVALAEFERGFTFIAAVLGGGQLFLHLAFSYASAPAIVITEPGHAVIVESGGGHGVMPASGAGAAGMSQAADVASWSPAMTLAHVAATLAAAALMAYGERAVWRLAQVVLPLLWVFLRPAAPPLPKPLPISAPVAVVRRYGVLLARSRPRRGPPVRAAI
jgi:hypothetical protein